MIDEASSKAANKAAGKRLTDELTAEDFRKMVQNPPNDEREKADAEQELRAQRAKDSGCEPCMFAVEHGHWGDTIPVRWTHCRDCHISWPGTTRWGHCSTCHQTFSGGVTFDDHHNAKACALGTPPRGTEATWSGHAYVVKHREKGDLLYWGSAEKDEE